MSNSETVPISELGLIANLAHRASTNIGANSPAVRLGIGDDCALLRPPKSCEIAITTDFSLENRHFRRNAHPPESVGHRALARGLSDLAAMGATPMAAFLSLAVPPDALVGGNDSWASRFLSGLLALAAQHRVPLAGGDTSESPSKLILADIVLVGSIPAKRALLRSGAKPGDKIYVTGTLGGSAAELASLLREPKKFASLTTAVDGHPQLYPQPRLAVGRFLLKNHLARASAAIDLSDGLSTDLNHLALASNVSSVILADALPIASDASLDNALNGGEDYELLFTAPAKTRVPSRIASTTITYIGTIVPHRKGLPRCQVMSSDGNTKPLKPKGFEHFR